MKNLKKVVFGLVALIVAFGLVFTVSAFKAKKETRWFIYTQSDHPTNATDAKEPSNYTMLDANELPPCDGEQDLCAIRADVVSGQPDISGAVATAIDNYFAPSPSLDPLYIAEKN